MKLHELLAIDKSLGLQADKTRGDLANTFEKKRHLFEEKKLVFTPLAEGAPSTVENQSDIQTTVKKEYDWVREHLVKAFDAAYQVAETNTVARADISLEDGTVIAAAVPATALLELEKSLADVTALIAATPTLDPAKGFTKDANRDLFQARPVTKTRTKKDKVVIVKYEATKEHPAQTELIDKDIPVGTIQEQEWSGLITPSEKAALLNQAEVLSRAVRQARARANDQEVDKSKKIGEKLLGYIFG